ncbi:hypothetical protein [uncultured Microbacterium sp.]|uniref:hypothetical protein n=1 Tax=uncultured Microbacterium sp. TaxID=191216 RepID=UPI0028ED2E77|nr:hypothetical protein [uncultured Microbacterium sp.]
MTHTAAPTAPATSLLAGAPVIARIRRLLVTVVIAGFLYTTLMTAQKQSCPGGSAADGQPACTSVVFSPSPIVLLALAVVVFIALGRVLRAGGEAQALRILDRTAAVIWVIVIASLVIGYVWFALMPIPEPGSSFVTFFPFPFASGQISFTP